MIINPMGAFNAVQRVASTVGLRLQIDPTCTQPVTDLVSRVIYLPPLYQTSTPSEVKRWRAYNYHEVGHHAPNCIDILQVLKDNKIHMGTLFGRVINVLDDIRNERNQHGEYPGRDSDLEFTQAWHAADGARQFAEAGEEALASTEMRVFSQVLGLAYRYRGKTFQPDVSLPSLAYDKIVDSSRLDKFHTDIDNLRSGMDVVELARKILDDDPETSAEEEEQKARDKFEEAEKEKGEKGKGAKSEDQTDGEQEGEGDPMTEGKVSYKDLLAHDHDDETSGHKGMLKIIYDHDPADDYICHTTHTIEDIEPMHYIDDEVMDLYRKGSRIGNEVVRLFQAKSQRRRTYRHESGKLSGRDLHRLMNKDFDIFQRMKPQDDMRQVAVTLLVDCSGSMGGLKMAAAAASAALMSEPLSVVGIRHNIIGFTDSFRSLVSFNIKGFREKNSADVIMRKFTRIIAEDKMNSNADGESLIYAAEKLMAQRATRRIMLVLSDGQPASHRPGDAHTHTQNVVKSISNQIECYGIGIMSSAVKDIYPEHTVLSRTQDLQSCLLNVIKSKIVGA